MVSNAGDRRIRLAKLKFTDGKGGTANFGDGLAGYVLGHSTRVLGGSGECQRFRRRRSGLDVGAKRYRADRRQALGSEWASAPMQLPSWNRTDAIVMSAQRLRPLCSRCLRCGPVPASAATEGARPLQLEILINGDKTGLLGSFLQLPDGTLAARRSELVEAGVKVPGAGQPDDVIVLNDAAGRQVQV